MEAITRPYTYRAEAASFRTWKRVEMRGHRVTMNLGKPVWRKAHG